MTVVWVQDAKTMSKQYDTTNDPIVQEIPWTIMGAVNLIQVTKSGVLLVEGARIECPEEQGKQDEEKALDGSRQGLD